MELSFSSGLSPITFEVLLFIISMFAGVFGTVLGLGGTFIITPFLTLIFGVHIHYAIGASLVAVIAGSSGIAYKNDRDRSVNIRVASVLEVACIAGAILGASYLPFIEASWIFLLFSLMLFFCAYSVVRKKSNLTFDEAGKVKRDSFSNFFNLNGTYYDLTTKSEFPYRVTGVLTGFILMLGTGVSSALLGIGSGVFQKPILQDVMKLPSRSARSTSKFMLGATAATSAGIYFARGEIIPLLAAPIALGMLAGYSIGNRIYPKLQQRALKVVSALLILVIGFAMLSKFYMMWMGK